MRRLVCLSVAFALVGSLAQAADYKVPRTKFGAPDLQGLWTNTSLTFLQRAPIFKGLVATEAEEKMMLAGFKQMAAGLLDTHVDPNAPAPPVVKDAPQADIIEMDLTLARINGERRSSWIVEPADGKLPFTDAGKKAARQVGGNYEGPEGRPLEERCLIAIGSPEGPPMMNTGFNGHYQITQTRDHVAIYIEMNHDVRVIRLTDKGRPSERITPWMGDSVGWWEGDTLVVETTNFHPNTYVGSLTGGFRWSEKGKLVERFTRTGSNQMLYEFAAEDPVMFAKPWKAQMPMRTARGPIYEYACHEGNYSLPNALSGARVQEKEAKAAPPQPVTPPAAPAPAKPAAKERPRLASRQGCHLPPRARERAPREPPMNLDFSDDQKTLQDQVRRYLTEKCPTTAVRAILEGPEPFDRALYKGLAEMGALGVAIPEEYGGMGLSHLELCLVAEELGRAIAPVPVASSIYLAAEFLLQAGTEAQKQAWLPKLASGEAVGAFAFVEGQGRMAADKIHASVKDGKLAGVKAPVADGDSADVAIVAARSGSGRGENAISLFVVDLAGPGVKREALETIDPSRSYARITFDGAAAEPLGAEGDGWRIAEQVMDKAAILTAFEQVGGADKALEMARDYALDRMAFGRPIGSFQAIKHLLADMYVSATLARSNCYYGAWALASSAAELPIAAATARVSATQAFQHCAKNNIQTHGGMGFTWAFDCHLYYRRSNALALSLGSLSTWEDLLIERMRGANTAAA